jgi:arylsulfatase
VIALAALAAMLVACPGRQASFAAEAGKPEKPAKPNIVFILADDLGWGELGCYGQQKIRTPHLDRLAAEGLRFTQHYSGSAVCAPSRCALLTGRHMGHAAIRDNREIKPEGQQPLPDAEITLAELLRGAGYASAAIGKWGLGPPGSEGDPRRQGFDHFFGYNCQRHAHNFYPAFLYRDAEKIALEGNDGGATGKQYSHDLMEAEALAFIRQHKDRPFFLYLACTIPHLALQVPDDSLAEYLGKWDDPPYEGGKGYLPHKAPRAAYAAMVTRLDRSVGRVAALLKELGLDDRTLVLFSSDNGPTYDRLGGSDSEFFASAAGRRGLKGSLYEGGIRVPLVCRWPGRIRPGGTSDLASAFWDVLPTLCETAGIRPPEHCDGISFLPTLLGRGEQRQHEFLYWEFPAYSGQQAVRLGNWKGVRRELNKGRLQIELYDLAADPGEQNDLAAARPEVVARIEAIMAREHVRSPQFPLRGVDR